MRELSREISWTTKLIILVLAVGFISGILYLGYAFNNELAQNRQQSEQQSQTIRQLQEQLVQNNEQIGQLDKSTKTAIDIVSLAPRLKTDYYSGVCLIVGVTIWLTVKRKNASLSRPAAFHPTRMTFSAGDGDQIPEPRIKMGLTTERQRNPSNMIFWEGFLRRGRILLPSSRFTALGRNDLVKQICRNRADAPASKIKYIFSNRRCPFQ